jgi:SMC interacting uncharacterized protein involved in chromosome segregation
MTEEEMQKKMEFIIEKQAQFAVNMGLLREAQQRTAACDDKIAIPQEQWARMQADMDEVMVALAKAQQRTNKKIVELIAVQANTDLKMAKTDERLKHLVNVLEMHINEGHNGKSKGEEG